MLLSDDTPDDAVKIVVEKFMQQLRIRYTRNTPALGTPENWNAALRMANGDYVLLLHHDDAFASPESLSLFLQPFQEDPLVDFVFGRNTTVEELSGNKPFSASFFTSYNDDPEKLLTGNTIGAPSNVMLKASAVELYNRKYKWIVDIDMYIRLFRKKRKFFYIDKELIKIGIHEGQVSNECVDNHDVLLFENISFAMDRDFMLRTWKLYDFYWRLLRNAGIRSAKQLERLNLPEKDLPVFIEQIINFQNRIPPAFLRLGPFSKLLMMLGYSTLQHR